MLLGSKLSVPGIDAALIAAQGVEGWHDNLLMPIITLATTTWRQRGQGETGSIPPLDSPRRFLEDSKRSPLRFVGP